MSSDVQYYVNEKLSNDRAFSLSEANDISKMCQILSYIRFVEARLLDYYLSYESPSQSTILSHCI